MSDMQSASDFHRIRYYTEKIDLRECYFSLSETPGNEDDFADLYNKPLRVYGHEDDRPDIYLHLLVKDLYTVIFGSSSRRQYIKPDTEIFIDFYKIWRQDAFKIHDLNDLSSVKEYVEYKYTITINCHANSGSTVDDTSLTPDGETSGAVSGLVNDSVKVTQVQIRNHFVLGANYYDICIKLDFEDEQEQELLSLQNAEQYIFAWAWVKNEDSLQEYNEQYKTDVLVQNDRKNLLFDSNLNFFDGWLSDFIKRSQGNVSSENLFSDGFPFDEPTFNFIEIINNLPFTSFRIGRQLGPIGICRKDDTYFDDHQAESTNYRRSGNIGAYEFLYEEQYHGGNVALDSDGDPDLYCTGPSPGLVEHGIVSNLSEYHSRADNRFIFVEKSAAHWLNSLEQKFLNNSDTLGDLETTIKLKGNYPFDLDRIDLLSHDFLKNYYTEDHFLLGVTFIDHEYFSLNDLETLQTVPESDITAPNGTLLGKICRGIPGIGFMGTAHTKSYLYHDTTNKYLWQNHAYAQRPLFVVFNLDREFTQDELDYVKSQEHKPLLEFVFYNVDGVEDPIDYPLDIDWDYVNSAGTHGVLIYLNTPHVFSLSLKYGQERLTVYQSASHNPLGRNLPCKGSLCTDIDFYTPSDHGLFQNNPIIAIDDFSALIVRKNKQDELTLNYQLDMTQKTGSFILGLIPKYGKYLSTAWDLGFNLYRNQTISRKNAIDATKKSLDFIFLELLKKNKKILKVYNTVDKFAGPVISTLNYFEEIEKITEKFKKTIATETSPYYRGEDFGDCQFCDDSLILFGVKSECYKIDKDLLTYSLHLDVDETYVSIYNRKISEDVERAFDYQFGDTGGLVVRPDSKYNDIDTVSGYRLDFQQKLSTLKDLLNEQTASQDPMAIIDFIRTLANGINGKSLDELFTEAQMNLNLSSYADENKPAADVIRDISTSSSMSQADEEYAQALLHIILYINVSYVQCPVCGGYMDMSWGWCPFHATKQLPDLEDLNNNVELDKDDFKSYLVSKGNKTVQDYINMTAQDSDKILVHWTEFIVVK